MRRIGFRPQISDSLAHTAKKAVFPRVNAPPIQEYPAAEWRSAVIVGIVVATIVTFRAEMKSVDLVFHELASIILDTIHSGQKVTGGYYKGETVRYSQRERLELQPL